MYYTKNINGNYQSDKIKSSSYNKVFNNIILSSLFSSVSGRISSNGRKLEDDIYDYIPFKKNKNYNIDDVLSLINREKESVYFKSVKFNLSQISDSGYEQGIEVDTMVFTNNKLYLFEIKSSANFDTTNSNGIAKKGMIINNYIKRHINSDIDISVITLVSWSSMNDKDFSVKTKLPYDTMTVTDFCKMCNLDTNTINNETLQCAKDNLNFFIKTQLTDKEMRNIMFNIIKDDDKYLSEFHNIK